MEQTPFTPLTNEEIAARQAACSHDGGIMFSPTMFGPQLGSIRHDREGRSCAVCGKILEWVTVRRVVMAPRPERGQG